MFDLVIRNADVVDGTGTPRCRADVAVDGGRIVEVGRVGSRGHREIDAEGHVVTPGFIDGHTHLDAQINWDPLGTSSCWHGVTTAIMGNCGFTIAPVRKGEEALVVRNLERSEDIPAEALAEGITWAWENFAEYLDVLDRLPKGLNVAANIGHSALRTWAMGERAFSEEADPDDLARMEIELARALEAGAVGFTTSRGEHETSDDRPVASRLASWDELTRLTGTVARSGHGGLGLALGGLVDNDPERESKLFSDLAALAVSTKVPISFGVLAGQTDKDDQWRRKLRLIEETASRGGRMFGLSHCREFGIVLSFKTQLPFDTLEGWRQVRSLPLEEQRRALEDPERRRALVESARRGPYPKPSGGSPHAPDYDWIRVVQQVDAANPTVAELAGQRGCDPVDLIIDCALDTNFDQMFLQVILQRNRDDVRALIKHPRNVMTFSDSGAHVSQIMDSSIQTNLLAFWVRELHELSLEEAVKMITLVPALAWGFHDRGLVRPGMAADLNVIDPERIASCMPTVETDLPGGARRLKQRSVGIRATVVGGEVVIEDGEHSGALPGRLIRF